MYVHLSDISVVSQIIGCVKAVTHEVESAVVSCGRIVTDGLLLQHTHNRRTDSQVLRIDLLQLGGRERDDIAIAIGECQIALSPKPQDVTDAKTDKSLAVVQTPAFMTAFVALNTDKKPLDNQKVRAALNMAFDRTTYLKTVFDNTATAAVNPYPPNTWSYNKSVKPWPYDPVKAKNLLATAGFPNGFATERHHVATLN